MNNIEDLMINEMSLHNGKKKVGYGLKDLAKRYLNFDYDNPQQKLFETNLFKETRDTFPKLGKKEFTYDQIIYGAKDVEFAYLIYFKQLKTRQEFNKNLFWLENQFTLVLGDIEFNGMPLSTKMWLDNEARYREELEKAEEKLATYLPKDLEELN